MWAGPLVCMRIEMLAVILGPILVLAEQPWTAAIDADACTASAGVCRNSGGAPGAALLQVAASHTELAKSHVVTEPSKMSPLSISYVGNDAQLGVTAFAASLDEDGYRKVMELKSKFQTTNFINRLVEQMDLKVINEDLYRGYILSLGSDSDFNGIRWMLEHQAEEPCGWVASRNKHIEVNGETAPLSEYGYMQVVELRNTYEMFRFAIRVLEEEGLHMSKHKGKLHGMLSFYNCEKSIQSLERMRTEFMEVADSEFGWLKKGDDFKDDSGSSAPLTEEGYRAVYDLCNSTELFIFTRRLIDEEGFKFTGEKGKLYGLLEYYGCEKGIQSLKRLRDELDNIAKLPDGWLTTSGSFKQSERHTSKLDNNDDSTASHDNREGDDNNNGNNNNDGDSNNNGNDVNGNDNDNDDNHNNDGSSAELTESGYKQIAKLCSKDELFNYGRRVIENEGLSLSGDEGNLHGLLEYYNCDKVQSLERMREELHKVASESDGWVSPRIAKDSSEKNEDPLDDP